MGNSGFDQALTKYWDWNNEGVGEKLLDCGSGFG